MLNQPELASPIIPYEPLLLNHPEVEAKASGVTVIVPAYNESDSLADTIQSLKMQTVPPEEIIVIDDCSTDGTLR